MPRLRPRGGTFVMSCPPIAMRPRVGHQEAGDELQQGRLAAAAGADHRDQLAGADRQVDVEYAGLAARIGEADRVDGDGGTAHAPKLLAACAPRAATAPPIDASRARASRITVAAQANPVAP